MFYSMVKQQFFINILLYHHLINYINHPDTYKVSDLDAYRIL